MRIGYGIDFHQLVEGRDLVIGGITIPHTKGALGHSDADVLLHAICDALLGALALISYAFIYTPFKRISPVSVFIGAIPGSIPLLIGYTAASGTIGTIGIVLFTIQFFWQIPHFWSIAWLLDEDYKKAGYFLLPSNEGKTRNTALQNIPYLIGLLAVSALPFILNISGIASLIVSLIAGIYFLSAGIQLATDLSDKSARKLMFASFIYLPVVFLALVLDKI